MILWVWRFKVTLRPDAIELQRFFSTRRLTRLEIKERRLLLAKGYVRGAGISELVLVPQDSREKELHMLMIIENDDLFHAWFKVIPNADKRIRAYR